jgi:predicted alpha/beta superfamily hydrolase
MILICLTLISIYCKRTNKPYPEPISRYVTYPIGHYENIYSNILNEKRTILVHLPDNYETSSKKYPVLYVLDAEDSQRFINSIAAITFNSRIRRLPRMIVVGIINTDRTRDITPFKVKQRMRSGGGDLFLDFINSEIIPHVEGKYRCAPLRIFFGGSSAGTLILYTLFTRPELFDMYIASRPALNSTADYSWDIDIIFQEARIFISSRSKKKLLYMDHGSQEDDLHDPEPIRLLSTLFERDSTKDFNWEVRQIGESGYRSAKSLMDGLISFFDNWYYPADSLFAIGSEGIFNHAKILSDQYGYAVTLADILDESELLMFGYRFLEHGNLDEAIRLFKYAVETYPNSWNSHDSLAEAYMNNGQIELAILHYRKSLELNPKNTNAFEMLKKINLQNDS